MKVEEKVRNPHPTETRIVNLMVEVAKEVMKIKREQKDIQNQSHNN